MSWLEINGFGVFSNIIFFILKNYATKNLRNKAILNLNNIVCIATRGSSNAQAVGRLAWSNLDLFDFKPFQMVDF